MNRTDSHFQFDLYQSFAEHWCLDPDIAYLNHGSFGACPKVILDLQTEYRAQLEARSMQFMVDDLEPLLDRSREALGKLVKADAEDLVFVPNITHGVNTVLRSLQFEEGDELLTTNHAYNACANVLHYVAGLFGAKVVVADIPFPIEDPQQAINAIGQAVSSKTRLALIDHITSPTAIVLPIKAIVEMLESQGIDVLVDGAHGPGMVELGLNDLGAAYYTANCHKWLCTPKGSGFLHIRKNKQHLIRPLCISHGANNPRKNRPFHLLEFDWPGTIDPTPYLVIPEAIDFLSGLLPGGMNSLMARNREVAIASVKHLAEALQVELPAPESMIGSIATIKLPNDPAPPDAACIERLSPVSPLQDKLYEAHKIQTVMNYFPKAPERYLRVSAQAHNTLDQYERLAEALLEELQYPPATIFD